MKKFTKLFLSCVAAAALTTAVAATAMAADEVAVSYAKETKTITVTTNYEAAQKTLLVLPKDVKLDAATSSDIIQIDQKDAYTSAIPVGELADGYYTVYMGGAGQVYSADFYVGDGIVVLLGDANQDQFVDGDDASNILQYNVDKYTFTGNGELAADANQDEFVDGDDAAAILRYNVDRIGEDNKFVGQEITVAAN